MVQPLLRETGREALLPHLVAWKLFDVTQQFVQAIFELADSQGIERVVASRTADSDDGLVECFDSSGEPEPELAMRIVPCCESLQDGLNLRGIELRVRAQVNVLRKSSGQLRAFKGLVFQGF